MGQNRATVNLGGSSFPFLSFKKARTVLLPQVDQQYIPGAYTSSQDKEQFIPNLYYCDNVMPTKQGYQSIGYKNINTGGIAIPLAPGEIVLDTVKLNVNPLAALGQFSILAITSLGKLYITKATAVDNAYSTYTWVYMQTIPAFVGNYFPGEDILFAAFVNGKQYLYIPFKGCYVYNPAGPTFDIQVLSGLVPAIIGGICASNGYLVAWTNGAGGDTPVIYWSSTIDPTDFVPSLITGAGSGAVQDAKGDIILCASLTGGFIIYTDANAVSSTYSGNSRFPFNTRELVNSGGVISKRQVAYSNNGSSHYIWSSKGLQQVSLTATQNNFSDVEDFLGKRQQEDFNVGTLQFVETDIGAEGKYDVSLQVIGGRYLVLSYGVNLNPLVTNYSYNNALVLDLGLQRWGKLKFFHSFLHDFAQGFNPQLVNTQKGAFILMGIAGFLDAMVFDIPSITNPIGAVAIFGKYQYVRTNLIQLENIAVELNTTLGTAFSIAVLYTLDGKNYVAPLPNPPADITTDALRSYYAHIVGENCSLVLMGRFDLTSLLIEFYPHGRR